MIPKLSYIIKVNDEAELLLPFGIKKMRLRCYGSNFRSNFFNSLSSTSDYNDFEFPIINGKSPCYLKFYAEQASSGSGLAILIEEIGGVPEPSYFGDELTKEKVEVLRETYNELIGAKESTA